MIVVFTVELTAEGTVTILVDRFIPRLGCTSTLLSNDGLQLCAQLRTAVYKLLDIHKLTRSAYHLSGNGGVEYANQTLARNC